MTDEITKIERIDTDAAFVEWRDNCEDGKPYGAVLVGGCDYVLAKTPEVSEELEAELTKVEALGDLEADIVGELGELRKLQERAAGLLSDVDDCKAQALKGERLKLEELRRIVDELQAMRGLGVTVEKAIQARGARICEALDRLSETIRTIGAGP